MYVSLNWLQEYVDFEVKDPLEFASIFTKKVVMIDQVIFEQDLYKSIVTAKITNITRHPKMDKLLVAKCTDGKDDFSIVTGAQNIFEGAIVPLALEGAIIPINQKEIQNVDFKGISSEGMFCSSYELKIDNDHSGIYILDKNTPVGVPISEVLNLKDVIFFIDNPSITHRPDLWGHYGIAREIAAILNKPLKPYLSPKRINIPDTKELEIEIESFEDTPSYGILHIKNITKKETPAWIKRRLLKVNQRPISLLVDLTNYIMFDIGQPCHAFDLNKIKKTVIKIRRAENNEKVVTLDQAERELNSENLLICDYKNNPIAIAGVMGLANSEIDDDTQEILLEVANFNPALIRKSSLIAGIRTEASNRFEKSLDPSLVELSIYKFAQILESNDPNIKLIGKNIISDKPPKKSKIIMPIDLISKRLGVDIPDDKVIEILKNLEFDVSNESGILSITVPTFRSTKDVKIPEDIVEEVGRIYGYDYIIPKAPEIELNIAPQIELPLYKRQVKEFLSNNLGFSEVLNYPFTTEKLNSIFGFGSPLIKIKNPLDIERPFLTKTLLPNILKNVSTNLKYFNEFRIYEVEHVFFQNDDGALEEPVEIAGALIYDNYDLAVLDARDVILSLCDLFNIENISIKTENIPSYLHPYKSGIIFCEDKQIGIFGEIHPDIIKEFDIKKRVSVFTSYLETFIKLKGEIKKFSQISKFPDISFDLAFVVPDKLHVKEIIDIIKNIDKNIRKVELFDIYQGKNIGEGKKSLAFNITLNSFEKTLNSDDEQRIIKKVVETLENRGYELRK